MSKHKEGERCEVCDKEGKAAKLCAFERGCACWYGVPCINGESMRKHQEADHA